MITKAPDLFWKQNHVTSQQPRGLCWEPQLILVPTRGTHQQLPAFKLPARTEHSKVCELWLSFADLTAKRFTSVDAHWKGRKRGKKKLTWRLSDGSCHRWTDTEPLDRYEQRAAGLGFPPQSLRCRRRGLTLSRSLGTKLQRPKISGTKHFSTVISYLTLAAAIFSLLLLRLPVKLHTALRR